MRTPTLALFLLFASIRTNAQTADPGQDLIKKKCNITRVSLTPRDRDHDPAPRFNSITVVDLRHDTSRIGIIAEGKFRQDQLVMHPSVNAVFTEHFNAGYTAPQATDSLLVVIKELWISDPMDSVWEKTGMFSKEAYSISCRLEGYWKRSYGYVPLTYLDTTILAGGNTPSLTARHALPELVSAFMNKVVATDLEKAIARRRLLSWPQIDSFAQTRYHFPMDTAKTLAKGVYRTADEFSNNAPSISNYEMGKDRSGNIELRTPEPDGRFIFTHTVWGFSDGKQSYVMMDGNLFPIFRVNHQFYVLGSKEYSRSKVWVPLYAPLGASGFVLAGLTAIEEPVMRKLKVYRLNLESGTVTR